MEPSEIPPPSAAAPAPPVLAAAGIVAGYGKKRVLDGVGLTVGPGEAVAVLGHNGAGKSTLLRAVFGLVPVAEGHVAIAGEPLAASHSPAESVRLGVAMIPSERFVFPDLTVLDNLRLGARGLPAGATERAIADAFAEFPLLAERRDQLAGSMSGGQQRLVSLAMALMRRPRLLLLDEPSLGLSPVIAGQIMEQLSGLVRRGMSIVLVEQNIPIALSLATRIYVMRGGRIILEETARQLNERGRENWWELF